MVTPMRAIAASLIFVRFATAAELPKLTVAPDGSGDFKSVQAAIDAAPETGALIRIQPGTYREVLTIRKPHVQLRGAGKSPQDVVLTFDLSSKTAGGTTKSASVTISGDDFYAENLTFENSYSRTHALEREGSQAVAVKVTGDRAVFRRVRFLGHQDTLYPNSKQCETDAGPCTPARQYFSECYIEGNVDFIFGDALAFFDHCEIHALAHSVVMITAQSKHYAEEKSGYVFDHCRLTAEKGADRVYLGRPWRAYSTVIFLNTEMGPEIVPEAWSEWVHNDKPSLPTVFYAEYNSTGPGARPAARDPHSHQLTATEAAKFLLKNFLKGDDG